MHLTGTITIGRQPADIYEFWHGLEHLPTFMTHLDEVRRDGDLSHWTATAPFGRTVKWDAQITEDVAGERMAWQSVAGSDIENSGVISFRPAPGGRGTELRVEIDYDVPAGQVGQLVARYFGEEPHQQLDDDLRRLKQVIETGEVVRSDGAPGGKQARREFPQHPARPLSQDELAELDLSLEPAAAVGR